MQTIKDLSIYIVYLSALITRHSTKKLFVNSECKTICLCYYLRLCHLKAGTSFFRQIKLCLCFAIYYNTTDDSKVFSKSTQQRNYFWQHL